MAATRRTAHLLRLPYRTLASPPLLLAAVAVSSSWSGIRPPAQAFPIEPQLTLWAAHRRCVHLPPRHHRPLASSPSDEIFEEGGARRSVTGPIYESEEGGPIVKLFTKEGCTLCDKVKDVLESVRESQPHSLYAVDITDDDKEEWFSKYKYDIPVLHIDDVYWAKHRLSAEDAVAGIGEAFAGDFSMRQGEPDASRLEHN